MGIWKWDAEDIPICRCALKLLETVWGLESNLSDAFPLTYDGLSSLYSATEKKYAPNLSPKILAKFCLGSLIYHQLRMWEKAGTFPLTVRFEF